MSVGGGGVEWVLMFECECKLSFGVYRESRGSSGDTTDKRRSRWPGHCRDGASEETTGHHDCRRESEGHNDSDDERSWR